MKADVPIFVVGNNNKVKVGGKGFSPKTVTVLVIVIVLLAVSLCCPDLRTDVVRWMISALVG